MGRPIYMLFGAVALVGPPLSAPKTHVKIMSLFPKHNWQFDPSPSNKDHGFASDHDDQIWIFL